MLDFLIWMILVFAKVIKVNLGIYFNLIDFFFL
jgi:hypothetical protein